MRNKLIGVSLMVLFLMGCNDLGEIQKNMIENNQRVENVLTNYNKVTSRGIEIEKEIVEYLRTYGDSGLNIIPELVINQDNKDSIIGELSDISNRIFYYETVVYGEDKEDEGNEYDNREEIFNIEEFINSILTVHYFLDDKTGTVEQLFLVEFPNGYTERLSLLWIGGEYIDFKEDRGN